MNLFLVLAMIVLSACSTAPPANRCPASKAGALSCAWQLVKNISPKMHDGNPVQLFDERFSNATHPHFFELSAVYEAGIVMSGTNAVLNAAILELQAAGGQMRSLRCAFCDKLIPFRDYGASYFRVTEEGMPIVVLERGSKAATVAHEMAHFRSWLKRKQDLVAKGQSDREAARLAHEAYGTLQRMRNDEWESVLAEWAVQDLRITDPTLISRAVFPEMKALRIAIDFPDQLTHEERALVVPFLDAAIARAILIRNSRAMELRRQLAEEKVGLLKRTSLERAIRASEDLSTLFDEMLPETSVSQVGRNNPGSGRNKARRLFQERFPIVSGGGIRGSNSDP